MKKIILLYLFPLFIAIAVFLCFNGSLRTVFFMESNSPNDSSFRFLENFRDNEFYENQFLSNNDSLETIFLLGSSELTISTAGIPYNFITDHFKTKLKGIGHAGNQCFSIYSQLLANENKIKNAPIVIILSPVWFQDNNAKGTSSSLFLEFNSPRFLNNIIHSTPDTFKEYETRRISDFYEEISNASLNLKTLHFEYQASKSPLHKYFYTPIIAIDKLLAGLQKTNNNLVKVGPFIRKPIISEPININWDSLYVLSKQEQINKSTNNKWYIDNAYYSEYIKGKTSTVTIVKEEDNQELKDFKMLMKLLKAKQVNVSFIIIPLNPFYYTNSKELSPIINSLEKEIIDNKFPFLNFWNADSTTFDNGVLRDIMHLSDYGWYKADKFIIETYKLSK